jgi:predicted amidohydrolase YtcJ
MPLKEDLDKVSPEMPVVLWRCDLHLSVANSKALQLAGIDENTENPPEGVIEHHENGLPNGVLREFASNLVKDVVPPPDEEDKYRAMKAAMPKMHAMGIASVNDVRLPGGTEGAEVFRVWQRLRRNDDLALRCWVSLPGERIDEAVSVGLASGFGDDRLRVGYLKFYADGGMGARTAWMIEPFLDAGSGMPLTSVGDLRDAMEKAEKAGLAIMVHAIGDRANREIVALLEERITARKPGANLPLLEHRIEHLQMIRPEDIRRLAALNVAACMQPPNVPIDINMIDRCLGPRGQFAYSFRSVLDAGVPVIFSSDCPVCNPAPLAGIHAAVTRSREDGTPEGGWYPSEKVTVEEAVRAYTISPARVYRMESKLGSISPGKLADMVVLDRNIFTEEPSQIAKTGIDLTLFDGKIVFEQNRQIPEK